MTTAKIVIDQAAPWYGFERDFDHFSWNKWMLTNRYLAVVAGGIYLAILFIGRIYMRNRDPFVLRGPLALWNLVASVFSIACFVRVAPYFFKRTLSLPFFEQMCENEYHNTPTTMFWLDVFVLTKPVEFIDTIFIVLRKQHLHFLHYYHHVTVVILCWYSLGVAPIPPNSIWYVAMNSYVHSFMYTYYLLRACKIHVPRIFQMSITIFQITQMVFGVIINVSPLIYRLNGATKCDAHWESIYLALAIYFSYFILFAEFFYKTYLSPSKKPAVKAKERSD